MAISRAQLAKELEPGLNALFGLEYDRYENEHAEIFAEESSDRSFEEEVMLGGFSTAPTKEEGAAISLTMLKRHSQHGTHTRQSLWRSQLLRKPLRIICMTVWHLATPRLWPVQWLRPSRLKLRLF